MPRVVPSALLLCALTFLFFPRADAASVPSGKMVHVMVQLRAAPLAADPNLKARAPATLGRFRLDPDLTASRWYSQALNQYQTREFSYVRGLGIPLSVTQRFHVLFDGFVATLPASDVAKLRTLPNVEAVGRVPRYHPLLDKSVPLVNAPAAWADLGGAPNAGKGMMIADIDSGIDITSPCFKDTGMAPPPLGRRADNKRNLALTNNKVIVARAFGSADPNAVFSAADTLGHGTDTAAIEACDYNTTTALGTKVSGVAPAAYLMNYNYSPPNADQSGSFDPVLAAMEAALLDGADVINMSIGLPFAGELQFDPESIAVDNATKAGVTVVISAGNAGPTPQSVTSPASAPDAIAVGAVTNSHFVTPPVSVKGPGSVPPNLSLIASRPGSSAWTGPIGPTQVVYVGLGRSPVPGGCPAGSQTCDPNNPTANDFAGKDLHGKIALIERGVFNFEDKIDNAQKAGAIGAIVFDYQPELDLVSMAVGAATLPASFISQADGQALLGWIQAHQDATVAMDSTPTVVDTTPDILSDFSSVGYGEAYGIKPDLVAPGQYIYSATETTTVNNELYSPSGWVTADGTSFSAPHVTGAAALVLQKHPKWTPSMVKSALMDTAGADIYTDLAKTQHASVMQAGAGMLDVGAAVASTAYLSPPSMSFGLVNAGYGDVTRHASFSINDAGGGSGIWQVSVQQLHGGPGLSVTTPASVSLSAGSSSVDVSLTATSTTPTGDYDGYIVLTRNGESLHVPYFAHVVAQAVKPGSVLLIDASTSRYQTNPPNAPVVHKDVSQYYEKALDAIGKSYTYWNEATLGTPSLADMNRASAVIVFTGNNLNAWNPNNQNTEALMPPLSPTDLSSLHAYVNGGGNLFVTGIGAAFLDGDGGAWTAIVLGANPTIPSVYDNENNDVATHGGISPPRPSASAITRSGTRGRVGMFAGLKPIDFSKGGNGAGDNLAVYNKTWASLLNVGNGMIGVSGMKPLQSKDVAPFKTFGQAVLQSTKKALADGSPVIAIASSDEPGFSHTASVRGRTLLFSFGFEGINDNTGYSTRAQVMQRVLQWFNDHSTASVIGAQYRSGRTVGLKAKLTSTSGAKAGQYRWQVGTRTLRPTAGPTGYRFPRAGQYRLRVQIADTLGHIAVSAWRTVTVR